MKDWQFLVLAGLSSGVIAMEIFHAVVEFLWWRTWRNQTRAAPWQVGLGLGRSVPSPADIVAARNRIDQQGTAYPGGPT